MNQVGTKNKITLLIACSFSLSAFSQSDLIRSQFIESLSKDLYKYYVSGLMGKQMGDSITHKYKTGGYDNNLNMDEFAFEITQDLRRISHDNHILVTPPHGSTLYDNESMIHKPTNSKNSKKITKALRSQTEKLEQSYERMRSEDMFSYGDICILPGNIGYIEIFDFNGVDESKRKYKKRITIQSAFEYLGSTKSIIIDLRENHGGLTSHAARFSSYFSKRSGNYFITTVRYFRYDSVGTEKEFSFTNKYYTNTNISNELIGEKSIFILTSNRTFSSAELAVYKIKQFVPSAMIVGEQTRGGGNGHLGKQFEMFYEAIIPSDKSIDESNMNLNLEGKGIIPDIYTKSDSAFNFAYRLASTENLVTTRQPTKYFNKKTQVSINPEFERYYEGYVGDYRKIVVYLDNSKLYMIYDTFIKELLQPVSKDVFKTRNFDTVLFIRSDNGLISEIQVKKSDGYLEKFRKN